MHRSRAPLRGQGIFFAAQFSAGYITNMPAFDLRQAQALTARLRHAAEPRIVRLPGKTGSDGGMVRMTRLTRNGHSALAPEQSIML